MEGHEEGRGAITKSMFTLESDFKAAHLSGASAGTGSSPTKCSSGIPHNLKEASLLRHSPTWPARSASPSCLDRKSAWPKDKQPGTH